MHNHKVHNAYMFHCDTNACLSHLNKFIVFNIKTLGIIQRQNIT